MASNGLETVETEVVQIGCLRDFTREAVSIMGFADEDAEIFTDVLVTGSLRTLPGQGQGVQQLPVYWERVQAGIIRAKAQLTTVTGDGATLGPAGEGSLRFMKEKRLASSCPR